MQTGIPLTKSSVGGIPLLHKIPVLGIKSIRKSNVSRRLTFFFRYVTL